MSSPSVFLRKNGTASVHDGVGEAVMYVKAGGAEFKLVVDYCPSPEYKTKIRVFAEIDSNRPGGLPEPTEAEATKVETK